MTVSLEDIKRHMTYDLSSHEVSIDQEFFLATASLVPGTTGPMVVKMGNPEPIHEAGKPYENFNWTLERSKPEHFYEPILVQTDPVDFSARMISAMFTRLHMKRWEVDWREVYVQLGPIVLIEGEFMAKFYLQICGYSAEELKQIGRS